MGSSPRIPPLPEDEWDGGAGDILRAVPPGADAPVGSNNVFSTFARHPDLFRTWIMFAGHLLNGGLLPPRDRELVILRTAVRCRSSYEWGQHVRLSLKLGIGRDEIDRVLAGAEAEGWSEHDAALLRAADELHDDSMVSDGTWATLAETYDERQLIELVMLAGQYHLVAFGLRSFGVPLDEGLEPLPD